MEKEGFKNKSDYLIYLKCGDLCGHFMALVSKKYLILKKIYTTEEILSNDMFTKIAEIIELYEAAKKEYFSALERYKESKESEILITASLNLIKTLEDLEKYLGDDDTIFTNEESQKHR